ncbi:Triacylglycerol lipase 1 [Platanthera zijinensis]|uniref:Triacylglycerol lipase 1 n=1 Tax=Platanthera zijinensis TaxID=2320716 RepID=A0AAP0B9Q8_9ASPA
MAATRGSDDHVRQRLSLCFETLNAEEERRRRPAKSLIRKGTFAKYDFGWWGNLKHYQRLQPPAFNLGSIPESLPLWMAYGGNDALADLTDLNRTINELKSKPELCYIECYGHIDFILSVNAKNDVYSDLIRFLCSREGTSSS